MHLHSGIDNGIVNFIYRTYIKKCTHPILSTISASVSAFIFISPSSTFLACSSVVYFSRAVDLPYRIFTGFHRIIAKHCSCLQSVADLSARVALPLGHRKQTANDHDLCNVISFSVACQPAFPFECFQVLAALSVSMGSMVVGYSSSYTSPGLVSMRDNETATFEVTKEIVSRRVNAV